MSVPAPPVLGHSAVANQPGLIGPFGLEETTEYGSLHQGIDGPRVN
ncbi:hypothetical protein [Auritidibacter ignavus]|nr:hypothetical protein [Auritidibacter ignavus]NIH72476.1 hypothetical protein [Auritidibacter ignavus]